MQATSDEHRVFDIGATVSSNKDVCSSIVAVYAASGCDMVTPYLGVGKATVLKKLREGKN